VRPLQQVESLFRLDGDDATELLLIRHAEPTEDTRELSSLGLVQSESLADALRGLCIAAVYSAPEPPARQTADTVGCEHGIRPSEIADLRDVEVQPSPGRDPTPYDSPSAVERFSRAPRWDSLKGFEQSRAFRRRVVIALESLVARHPAQRIVAVTHAAVINAYLSMVLDVPRDFFFLPGHASISGVRAAGGLYAVQALNDTAHLRRQLVGSRL
jgi:probable phosphoglycerate mutase